MASLSGAASIMRVTLATLFVGFHICGFPLAAVGCLLGGAVLTLTHLQDT